MLRAHPDLVNAAVGFGETPLFYIVESPDLKMADLLVRHHASINAHNDKGETPLMLCYVRSAMFIELLRLGADINAQDKDGDTILHLWAETGHDDSDLQNIRWLVSHGARSDIKNHDGETPVDLAAQANCPVIAEVLRRSVLIKH